MQNATIPQISFIRRWCISTSIFWTLLFSVTLFVFIRGEWDDMTTLGSELGLAAIAKDYTYRAWNAKHGGVYVPVTEETPPNQQLAHIQNRDVMLNGMPYTLMNPAYMTRQVHQLGKELYGLRGHFTSLKVIRPENSPDAWEKQALLRFEKGVSQVAELVNMDGEPFVRVMVPVITQEYCLKCHAQQGYKLGNLRGGSSTSVPMGNIISATKRHIMFGSGIIGIIYLAGLGGLVLFYRNNNSHFSERMRLEEDLQRKNFLLQGIVEHISSGIAVYETAENSKDFRVQHINTAGLASTKTVLAAVKGKKITEAFPGVEKMGLLEALQTVWEKGQPVFLPKSLYEDDTLTLWMEHYIFKLSNGEIVVVFNDVTEKIQHEQELVKKSSEWTKTFDAISDLIFIQDEQRKIVRANQSVADYFKIEKEKIPGISCYQLFRGEDIPCEECPVHASCCDGLCHDGIVEHAKLNRTFQVSTSPFFDQDNGHKYIVFVARDISEKIKLEQDLLQAQKMEAIGTLAGGIAHDFNNVLAAINGYSEMAMSDLPKQCDAYKDMEQVLKAAERATDLVRQILLFSRKGEHIRRPLRLQPIINEVMKMIRSTFPATIEIITYIAPDVGPVLASPTSIHQIIVNLCTNAMHAMAEKGILKVRLSKQTFELNELPRNWEASAGEYALISVEDDGDGMDKRTKQRIFEPYFTTKKHGEGTGLGLALVHGIVQNCGGFIKVESEPGMGTVFLVGLPMVPKEKEEKSETVDDKPLPGGDENILFVDDEQTLCDLANSTLTGLGYSVIAVNDSAQALRIFQANPQNFDLIISDRTMPKMTGKELTSAVLNIRPQIPIIICSGNLDADQDRDLRKAGVSEICLKPVPKKQLAQVVRRVIDKSKT